MSQEINVCRRLEDNPSVETNCPWAKMSKGKCSVCNSDVLIEDGSTKTPVCIHCAPKNHIIFVELPPDEFGRRSINVSVQEVLDKNDWHKTGVWHDKEWALKNVE